MRGDANRVCQHEKGVGHTWVRPGKYETQREWVASGPGHAQNTQTNFVEGPHRDKATSERTEKTCARTAWGYDTCGYRLGKFESELVVYWHAQGTQRQISFRTDRRTIN